MIAASIWAGSSYLFGTASLAAGRGRGDRCELAVRVMASAGRVGLEAQNAPLGLVLDRLAEKTGVRVHSSVIPEPRISASCMGANVQEMVECLFGPDADFVVRYSAAPMNTANMPDQELWVFGATFLGDRDRAGSVSDAKCTGTEAAGQATSSAAKPPSLVRTRSGLQEADDLLDMAMSKDVDRRIQGLSRMAIQGSRDNEMVLQTLTAALTDPNPEIRAQAVSGLARLGTDGTYDILSQALHDRDSSVRLMAVSRIRGVGVGEQATLLQQALADTDETVRDFAARKLDSLRKAGIVD